MVKEYKFLLRKIKSRIAMEKAAFKKKTLFVSKLDLNLRKKLLKCWIWSIALYDTENLTLQKVDQKHLESFEIWCWRRMEKISWTGRVKDEEVLQTVMEERNILHTIKGRKANSIGYILCRKCLLKHFIEGQIKEKMWVGGRRERRCEQLMDDLKKMKIYRR